MCNYLKTSKTATFRLLSFIIIFMLLFSGLQAVEQTEHRRALLIYSSDSTSIKKLNASLKEKGFIVTTLKASDKDATNKYDRYVNAIPTKAFNIIYYQGKIENMKDDMRFALVGKRTIASLRNPKMDKNPPVRREGGSLLDLSERLSRKQTAQNVIVVDCQGLDGNLSKRARGMLSRIGGAVFFSSDTKASAAEAINKMLSTGNEITKKAPKAIQVSWARNADLSFKHKAAQVCSPPGKLIAGRFAGDQWVGPFGQCFVWCPSGSYTMGDKQFFDSQPVKVKLSKGFWIGKYELTNGEAYLMGTSRGGSGPTAKSNPNLSPRLFRGEDLIELLINWQKYCKENDLALKGWSYDLPTEAEWEYAARAGGKEKSPEISQLVQYANFADLTLYNDRDLDENHRDKENGNAGGRLGFFRHADQKLNDGYGYAMAEVGSFKANSWGLHDTLGNAWELCCDYYSKELIGGTDPSNNQIQGSRDRPTQAMRGGGWSTSAKDVHLAFRNMAKGPDGFKGGRLVIRQGVMKSRSLKELQLEKRAEEDAKRRQKEEAKKRGRK